MPRRRSAALSCVLAAAGLGAALVTTHGAGAAASRTVAVKDDLFSPKALTVSKGTKVTFRWAGRHPHDVVGSGAATFKSKVQSSGTFSTTLRKAGTVNVLCQIHAGMTMKIKVK